MTDDDDMAALHHQQQLNRERIEQDLKDVIEQAQRKGALSNYDVALLKWGCGIQRRAQ